MSADARLLVDLDLGPAHRSRLTAASELFYFIYFCTFNGKGSHPVLKTFVYNPDIFCIVLFRRLLEAFGIQRISRRRAADERWRRRRRLRK